MKWKDRPREERALLKRRARAENRAAMEQWAADNVAGRASWNRRAAAVARLIREPMRVLDIGCGDMHVETLLAKGSTYIPLDCERRDERTIVLDLNRDPLPDIDADLVLALGVLEHMHDQTKLLAGLARFPRVILTYNVAELVDAAMSKVWVSEGHTLFTSRKLERLFARYGLKVVRRVPFGERQYIYDLKT